MDYNELNKELSTTRNNTSDWVKAMNDAEWHRILGELLSEEYPESPEGALEPSPEKRRSLYHDHGVKPPASPVGPQWPSIFVSPWVYHEIQAVLAECDAIERVENAKKTRWARLRKIDKMRRKQPPVCHPANYTSTLGSSHVVQYMTWIS